MILFFVDENEQVPAETPTWTAARESYGSKTFISQTLKAKKIKF